MSLVSARAEVGVVVGVVAGLSRTRQPASTVLISATSFGIPMMQAKQTRISYTCLFKTVTVP